MKNLSTLVLTAALVLTASSAYSQTLGCPEKDYNCQVKAAQKALEADPRNPEGYYNMGIVLQKAGAHKEAIELFSMYIAIPDLKKEFLADGYNNRGISQRKLGRADLAAADFSKAMELVPTDPKFVANRGNANTDLKKYDAALSDYAAALKLNPRFAQAHSGRAHLYGLTSRSNEAITDFTKAIEYDPNEAENFYNRAIIYRETRQYEKAVADFDKYIPLMSGNPAYQTDGHFNRGLTYAMLSRREEAVADFTKAIELDPKRVNAYRARAMIYREMKRDDLAAADEKKATELSKTK